MTARRIVALVTVAVVLVAGVFAYRTAAALASIFHTNVGSVVGSLIKGKSGSAIETDQIANLQRINIALYGYGGDGHDGAFLTDSIMVISIQPQRDAPPRVAEISIPRDWYVPMYNSAGKEEDLGRINQAYEDGMLYGDGGVAAGQELSGGAMADAALSTLLGIPIDYFVGVDFSAFDQAVDAVGGIDIDVPVAFTDDEYPAGECNSDSTCAFETVSFAAGEQHMDGATALEYARSRHGDNGQGTDFARSGRQQLIIAALEQKVLSIGGIGDLPNLLSALGGNVDTNLSLNDVEALWSLVKPVPASSYLHVQFTDQDFLYECTWFSWSTGCTADFEYAWDSSYQEVDHYTQNVFADPQALAAKATVGIEDGSGWDAPVAPTLSSRWATMFGEVGWTTADLGAVQTNATTQVINQGGTKDAAVAKWFASYFGVAVTTASPPSPGTAGSADGVIVLLGQDAGNAFSNDPGYGS
ncbi:MAG: LCP family protein [Candidatus Dormibacteria bacterium]|jgi:LCP family protein required for cell wall assembly